MNGTQSIRTALTGTQNVLQMYLDDLGDADLLVRPTPGANHIAWQLGHLIAAERSLLEKDLPDTPFPALPAGFVERHGKATAGSDSPSGFQTKAEYLDLFKRSREATLAAVARLKDSDLDRPTVGGMARFAPTLGELLLLVSNHTLMHAGQFTVVRRKLGKPVLF